MIENFLSENNCIISNKIVKPTPVLPTPVLPNYITFADPVVKQICVENWGSDGEITYGQAAAVTDLNGVFDYWSNNPPTEQITSFNELQYFRGLINLGESPDGNGQFSEAEQLVEITLPPNLVTLGYGTFDNCTGLISITIGNSVTSIGSYAFNNCNKLTSVIVESLTPPIAGSDMFSNNVNLTNIYVPAESVDAYKTAEGWSDYASKISAII